MTILEMTDDTMARLGEAVAGKGKFTVREVVYAALAGAMADAFDRGIETGKRIAEKAEVQKQICQDMTGKICEKCQDGEYRETRISDDWAGVLHCVSCDHEVVRHQQKEAQND